MERGQDDVGRAGRLQLCCTQVHSGAVVSEVLHPLGESNGLLGRLLVGLHLLQLASCLSSARQSRPGSTRRARAAGHGLGTRRVEVAMAQLGPTGWTTSTTWSEGHRLLEAVPAAKVESEASPER